MDQTAWTSLTRTPPLFPDAVTLTPAVTAPDLLARIDPSAGCSIKDSFASLDLGPFGFTVLFEAQWIVRLAQPLPPEPGALNWQVVREPRGLAQWERVWCGEDGPSGVIRVELLGLDSVAILAAHDGPQVVAGAILNRSSTVVGVSNFFAESGAESAGWVGCLRLADALFPSATLVGYEAGDALVTARRHGFVPAGPLRVWINDVG